MPNTITVDLATLASTAIALAANGANCSAGSYPLGVDAAGAVESCTAVSSGIGGPGSSTDKDIPTWSGTGGATLQDPTGVSIPSAGVLQTSTVAGPSGTLTMDGATATTGALVVQANGGLTSGSGTTAGQVVITGSSGSADQLLAVFSSSVVPTSITRSGSTATLTMATSPGFSGASFWATVEGAGQPEYNGTFLMTRVSCGSPCIYSYTVTGSPATPATGTIYAGPAKVAIEDSANYIKGGLTFISNSFTDLLVQPQNGSAYVINGQAGTYSFGTPSSGTVGTGWWSDVAGSIDQRNSTNQQQYRLYNTYSSAGTNYERLTIGGVAGASVNLTAESAGSGAANLDVVLTPKGSGKVVATAGLRGQTVTDTLPATCATGDLVGDIGTVKRLCLCVASNTWKCATLT